MPLLAPFSLPGRFWRGNLHTHSTLSDGAREPGAVIAAYREAGYDFMMLSDHFMAKYDWPLADTRGFRDSGFTTILGAELHAPMTSAGDLWHVLAAGLPLGFPACRDGETGPQIASRAREAGAFIAIAHPSWSQLTLDDGLALGSAHAVEIYNHVCSVQFDRGEGWYLLENMLRLGKRLTAIATDDAHFKHADHFGGWVHVKAESLDPELLLASLKRGHHYSSLGPQIDAVELDGRRLNVRCSPVDTIVVMGGNARTVRHMGRSITEAELDLARLIHGWKETGARSWFRVAVIDQSGKRAWTNPYWWDEVA